MGLLIAAESSASQEVISLYSGDVPNQINGPDQEAGGPDAVVKVSKPTLTVFLPAKRSPLMPAIIICPGGGYGTLVLDREGHQIAQTLAGMGFAAFVLKYRLPDSILMQDPAKGPLQDAQQALKAVRRHAGRYGVDTNKVGMMGFSAGGHLAAMTGTSFNQPVIPNMESANLRPDFLVLVYPVISFRNDLLHQGSMHNLLGKIPSATKRNAFSAELQVTPTTPPTFLVHATDDVWVPPGNSIVFL